MNWHYPLTAFLGQHRAVLTPVIVLQNCRGDFTQLELYDQARPRLEETAPTPVVT